MSLPVRTFVTRVVAVPAVVVVASVVGAITSSWWAAALLGFVGTLVFTAVSERILLGKLMGKIGRDPMIWYAAHAIGEALTIAAIAVVFHFVAGASIGHGLYFAVAAVATWIILAGENLRRFVGLLPMWLATRR